MPRKTRVDRIALEGEADASMRPRPDAAENRWPRPPVRGRGEVLQ